MARLQKKSIDYYSFYCPGCKHYHSYVVDSDGSQWEFNGDMEKPTFNPSLLNKMPFMNEKTGKIEEKERCHLWVTDGKIIFCSDCDHELAGQTVEIPDR